MHLSIHSYHRVTTLLVIVAAAVTVAAQGTWIVEPVATAGDVGFYHALAFAPNGLPSIAYSDQTNDDVRFASFDGIGWQTELVDGGKSVALGVDLAYNASGLPGISYAGGSVKLAERAGTAWSINTIVQSGAANDVTSLRYQGDVPYVAFMSGSGHKAKLQLAHRASGKWLIELVDTAAAQYKALAFDTSGAPVIAYSDIAGNGSQFNTLKVSRRTATGWQAEVVATGPTAGVFAGIAFDAAGNPGIVHGNGLVHYVAWSGQWATRSGGWRPDEVIDNGPFAGGESIQFAGMNPVISLRATQGTGFPSVIKVATGIPQPDGSIVWSVDVAASVPAPESFDFRTSLALDGAERPGISACLGRARDLLFIHPAP